MTQQTVSNQGSNVIGGICFLASAVLLVLNLIGVIHVAWWVIALPIFVYFGWILLWLLIMGIIALGVFIYLNADKRSKRKSNTNYGKLGR